MASADVTGPESDLTGRRLGGFLLTKRLGAGGFGSVYRGEPDVGVPRALKVLHDRSLVTGVRREAETLLALKHPRIVEFVHADLEADPPFIVMELVEGGSLSEVIPLDTEKALSLCRSLLEGLAHAHAKGIAHLDLKPQNVLLTADGPRITDFGLARAIETSRGGLAHSQSASAASSSGTLAYMSPEQREGRRGDFRSDVYAFGVLLCQLMTGRLPQPGDTLDELLGTPAPDWATKLFTRSHCRYEKRFENGGELLNALMSSKVTRVSKGGFLKCKSCGYDNQEGIKFCGECGAALSSHVSARVLAVGDPPRVKCPFCQEAIVEGAVKCKHCNERLDQPLAARAGTAAGTCAIHIDKTAGGACVGCGNLFCAECLTKVTGRNHCKRCVAELLHERDRKIVKAEEQIERERDRAARAGPNIIVNATGGSSSSSAAASSGIGGGGGDPALAAMRASIRRSRAIAALFAVLGCATIVAAIGTGVPQLFVASAILFLISAGVRPRYTGAQCPYCRGLSVRHMTRSGCFTSTKVLHCDDCKVDVSGAPRSGCLIFLAALGALAGLSASSACNARLPGGVTRGSAASPRELGD